MTNRATKDDKPQKNAVGRLKSRPQFLRVREGERRKGKFFLLEVLDRQEPDTGARVGYTVTKKHGNAVERNRMRRRLKAAVGHSAAIAMKDGHDYVIVARREVLTANFADLEAALSQRIESRPRQGNPRNSAPGKHDGKKP